MRFPILLKGNRESFVWFLVYPLNWLQKIKFNFLLVILRSTLLKKAVLSLFQFCSRAVSCIWCLTPLIFLDPLPLSLIRTSPSHTLLIFLYLNITYVYAPCSIGCESKSAPLWSSALAPINTSDPSNAPPFHKWQENNFFISEK